MVLDIDNDENEVKLLTKTGDYEGLVSFINSRVTNPDFINLLSSRDSLAEEAKKLDKNLDIAKGYIPDDSGNKSTSFVKIREATLESRKVQEQLSAVNTKLSNYRAVTALAAQQAAILRENREQENGLFLSYENDSIGSLVALGAFESGSPEWHRERSSGIGGSDVAKIMRTDAKYGTADYRNVLLTKLGLSEDSGSEEYREDRTSAVGRGNAWEEFIRYMYADKHTDQKVAFCKTSWGGIGEQSYKHANFDGLVLDENNIPEGIIEIKTGIHSNKWGDVKDGIFGAPENYRKQALWYAMNAGLSWGVLVAVLDDYDYREYTFSMDDPRVQEECLKIDEATSEFWKYIQEKKEELASGINTVITRRKGFGKTLNMKKASETIAAYSDEDFDTVYARVREAFKNVVKVGAYTQEQIQETLTALYAEHNPNDRKTPLIGIDIETNHAAVKKGRIIETGIVRLNVDGTVETLFSSVHGLPEIALEGLNVGDTSIHRITSDMIENVKPFDDPEIQKEILDYLKSGVIVAHNAGFEDRFLTVNLAGYAEARDAGEISILDTKEIVARLMLDSDSNSLESFAEDNGIPYVGAHAATADAIMMMTALRKFQETLHKKGTFVSSHSSKRARARAVKDVALAEENR